MISQPNELYKWLLGTVNEYCKTHDVETAYVLGSIELLKDSILETARDDGNQQGKG